VKDATTNISVPTIDEILKQWWGYSEFRSTQREIIESVLSGCDTLALMPTGGGKSLTYQVPALASEGLTIVITPLIALMKDQVDALRKRGISAVAVHSGMDSRRIEMALDNCTYGDVKLLYISPERLSTETFRVRLLKMNVSIVAVDEAHCISQWGYDFRPSYLRIAEIRKYIPKATFLALTASATDLVAKDIMHRLGFEKPHIIRSSFARPNLSYSVRMVDDKFNQLLRIIHNVEGTGIIYMRTREGCEMLVKQLQDNGISASFYHAGLPAMERSLRQDDWQSGKVRIMVATNAFGMGIDKADVRFVVHYTMCDSLEAYYQEAGRAGRDGKRSYAVLLLSPNDSDQIRRRFEAEFPPIEDVRHIYERIANYLQVAIGDGEGLSFVFNIFDFCHRERLSISQVENAVKLLEQNNYLMLIGENDSPAKMMFECSRDALYKVHAGGNDMDIMLRTILRMYDGLFTTFRSIDEQNIASHAGLSAERVHELMKILWRMHIIRYIPANRSPMIHLLSERLPTKDIYIAPDTYKHRYELIYERFSRMVEYANSTDSCRSVIIENYFGDNCAKECGVCDWCLSKRRRTKGDYSIDNQVIDLLKCRSMNVKELVAQIGGRPEDVVATIEKMVRSATIYLGEDGKLKINM
jgi:ATP-dependent DNA helicase RecQ